MKKYDIFISYRREGGSETSKMIRDSLTEKGYRVFLDIESLRSGQFNTELYRVIENSKDVVVVIPAHGLDRCAEADDWVRLEIEYARQCGKNIIPVFLQNFEFPEYLPPSLEFLRTQNGMFANAAYYDAFIEHLISFLDSKHFIPKSRRWIVVAISLVLILSITLGSVKYANTYPRTHAEKDLTSEFISYLFLNAKYFDLATTAYRSELEKTVSFLDDNSFYTPLEIYDSLEDCKGKLGEYKDSLTEMPKELKEKLADSPFNGGDSANFPSLLSGYIDYYLDNLELVQGQIVTIYAYTDDETITTAQKNTLLGVIKNEMEVSLLFAQNVFYLINEEVVPVTVESRLTDLKRDYLPQLTSIYSQNLEFCDDMDTIKGKEEIIYNKQVELIEKDKEAYKELNEYADKVAAEQ